jgi:hypothetical protein
LAEASTALGIYRSEAKQNRGAAVPRVVKQRTGVAVTTLLCLSS